MIKMGWLSYKGGDNLYPVEQGLFCSWRIMPIAIPIPTSIVVVVWNWNRILNQP